MFASEFNEIVKNSYFQNNSFTDIIIIENIFKCFESFLDNDRIYNSYSFG